jgi:membrane protein implicated in regulation of membrane protease activity
MAVESLLNSFVTIWIGISFIIVGLLSKFIIFEEGLWQLALVSIISTILLVSLRSKLLNIFLKEKDSLPNENFLNSTGAGIFKNNKIYFNATYWDVDSDESFEENEKVEVLNISNNTATIQKINKG